MNTALAIVETPATLAQLVFATATPRAIRSQRKTGHWDLTCEEMAEVTHALGRSPRIAEVREVEALLSAMM